MKGLKTFRWGGVHPPDGKTLARECPIRTMESRDIFTVPLGQHLGRPAEALVAKGDQVEEGQKIGGPSGFISASVHSPVSGEVVGITEVVLPSGAKSQALQIQRGSEDLSWDQEVNDPEALSSEELLEMIADAGLVGLGGATFPTHIKFNVPKGKTAEILIINGVECEPYLTADHRLMIEKRDQVLRGISIFQKILGVERVVIGIEANKPDAIAAFRSTGEIEVVPLKVKYPQGDEKQLIQAVTGREVPSGALPIEVGAVVTNVGTAFAAYEAVVLGKPLFERVVTVSGGAIAQPGNFRVKVGTPIRDLIEAAGGFKTEPVKLVAGGPMMGFGFFDLDTPVVKGTSGILALTEKEVRSGTETACLSCGRCIMACPMGLNPTKLYKMIDHSAYSEAGDAGLMDCKECGCCAFSCPARIPLVQGMRVGKRMLRKQ